MKIIHSYTFTCKTFGTIDRVQKLHCEMAFPTNTIFVALHVILLRLRIISPNRPRFWVRKAKDNQGPASFSTCFNTS